MPPSPAPGTGAKPATIRMRVTFKGDGLIHTGEVDLQQMRALKFAEGEEFECPTENVDTYESRGIAIRVAPAPASRPEAPSPPAPIDSEAIARLKARTLRDAKTGCLVWQGSKAKGGYGQITYRRMLLRTHRLAFEAHHGPVSAAALPRVKARPRSRVAPLSATIRSSPSRTAVPGGRNRFSQRPRWAAPRRAVKSGASR